MSTPLKKCIGSPERIPTKSPGYNGMMSLGIPE
jgi:hypothetical protein